MKDVKKISSTLQNKGMRFLLIQLKKPLIKLLAHLDTGNQQNCNKICVMLSLFTESITDCKST